MQYEEIESECTGLLRQIRAVSPVSMWALAGHCGLAIRMEGTHHADGDVAVIIPCTADLHEQEAAIGTAFGRWRMRRWFGACTREEAAYCGRALHLPRADFQRDIVQLRAHLANLDLDTDELRDAMLIRGLMRKHTYASATVIRARISDLAAAREQCGVRLLRAVSV